MRNRPDSIAVNRALDTLKQATGVALAADLTIQARHHPLALIGLLD
jgi:hypothetical protein